MLGTLAGERKKQMVFVEVKVARWTVYEGFTRATFRKDGNKPPTGCDGEV